MWDTASRTQLGAPLTGHTGWVRGIAISPDGALIATAGMDTTVRLWDVAARTQVGAPLTGHTNSVTGVAFSPDGRVLATAANDMTVRLWDVATRSPLGEPLTGHTSAVRDVAFSPDGAILASVGDDKTVRLWDVAGRTQIAVLVGHTGEVLKVAFSPDGRELASAGLDKTLRLSDVESRSTTTTFTASTGLAGVAFVPGGLVTGGVTGNVLRWTTNVEQAAAYVCAATDVDLTDEEWHRHVPSWPTSTCAPDHQRPQPTAPTPDGQSSRGRAGHLGRRATPNQAVASTQVPPRPQPVEQAGRGQRVAGLLRSDILDATTAEHPAEVLRAAAFAQGAVSPGRKSGLP